VATSCKEQRFGLSKRRIAIPYDGFSQVHLMELVNKCWRPRPWLLLVVHFTTLALPGYWIFSRLKISLNEGHMSQFLELLQTSNEIYYYYPLTYPLVEISCVFFLFSWTRIITHPNWASISIWYGSAMTLFWLFFIAIICL
jgi:hypothetical protein